MIVGIHGLKRSGKDAFADRLIPHLESLGCTVGRFAYADRLKESLAKLFGVSLQVFYRDDLKEQYHPVLKMSPRALMTSYSVIMKAQYGDDVLIRGCINDVQEDRHDVKVITDVRYAGLESDWIREAGGLLVHVRRDGVHAEGTPSESDWDDEDMSPKDYFVHNHNDVLWSVKLDNQAHDIAMAVVSILDKRHL